MNRLRKLLLPIVYKLHCWNIISRKRYMQYLEKYHTKRGVEFLGEGARFIACDVELDTTGKITVGQGTTIASKTTVLTHDFSIDYGMIAANIERDREYKMVKAVTIGSNTFIGQRCIVLPGVTIGSNCIIGAGTLVNQDIPDNSVCAGVPVKILAQTDEWARKKIEKEACCIV